MKVRSVDSEKQRVQFYFDTAALAQVDAMRACSGLATRAEAVRYALRLFKWYLDETGAGSEILVKRKNGELKGILLPLMNKNTVA